MQMNRQILSVRVAHAVALGCAMATLLSGCAGSGPTTPVRSATKPGGAHLELSPTELGGAVAKIVSVNPEHGFVVIDFATRPLPAVGTRCNVYHGEKRVGAVRITEPERPPLVTADILEGQARMGDEVR